MDQASFDRLRRVAGRVFANRPVLFAYLFGPAARGMRGRTGEPGPGQEGGSRAGSDRQSPGGARSPTTIDVAVYVDPSVPPDRLFAEGSLRLRERLLEVPGEGVNVLVLNRAPLSAQWRVLQEGVVLYDRDERTRGQFESTTRHLYEEHQHDVRPLALRMLSDLSDHTLGTAGST